MLVINKGYIYIYIYIYIVREKLCENGELLLTFRLSWDHNFSCSCYNKVIVWCLQTEGDISAYTYERTLMMEQRTAIMKNLRLNKKELPVSVSIVFVCLFVCLCDTFLKSVIIILIVTLASSNIICRQL